MTANRMLRMVCSMVCRTALLAGMLSLAAPQAESAPAKPADAAVAPRATNEVVLAGTCVWGGGKGTVTATLTPATNGTYGVVYDVSWKGGKSSTWKGAVKSDLKTDITGDGTTGDGKAVFDFSGKFVNGSADCKYVERGKKDGGRRGTLTLSLKK